jgi:hypothetical protein
MRIGVLLSFVEVPAGIPLLATADEAAGPERSGRG